MKLSNKVYDLLKWIAMIALDAAGVCYSTLSGVWGWPLGEQILQTCAAVSILLGALLGASSAEYHRGNTGRQDGIECSAGGDIPSEAIWH